MTVGSVPTRLEAVLGHLVAAGVAQRADLAAVLGLEAAMLGRPVRGLLRTGVLATTDAGLEVTPRGRIWLDLEPPAPEPRLRLVPATGEAERTTEWTRAEAKPRGVTGQEGAAVAAPRLPVPEPRRPTWWHQIGRGPWAVAASIRSIISASHPEPEGARHNTPASAPDPHTGGAIAARGRPTRHACQRTDPHTGRAVAAVRARALQRVRGAGQGCGAAPPASRRANADVQSAEPRGGRRLGRGPHGRSASGRAVGFWSPAPNSVVQAAATPPRAAVPAATPVPGPPTEQWLLVQHTDGLGLVLRPSPGSPERVLTLQEGARLRVIGDPVEQAGRSWLPVASPGGKSGWVAETSSPRRPEYSAAEDSLRQIAVQQGNEIQADALGAHRLALAVVAAVSKAFRIVLRDHGAHPPPALGLALRQQTQMAHLGGREQHRRRIRTRRHTRPQPIQVAASKARSAWSFATASRWPPGALPASAEIKPPAWMMRSKPPGRPPDP